MSYTYTSSTLDYRMTRERKKKSRIKKGDSPNRLKANTFFYSLNEFKAKINKAISYWLCSSDLPSCTVHCVFMYFIQSMWITRPRCVYRYIYIYVLYICICGCVYVSAVAILVNRSVILCEKKKIAEIHMQYKWYITFKGIKWILSGQNVDHTKSKRSLYQFPYLITNGGVKKAKPTMNRNVENKKKRTCQKE